MNDMAIKRLQGSSDIPYSSAVIADGTIYTAGQIGQDSAGNVPDDIDAQVRITLANLKATVEAAGGTIESVMKVLVFLVRREDFDAMNRAYKEVFSEPYPARSTIITDLATETLLVEMEAIARVVDDEA
jgi:2-iminobutanoate/2-iminopropanoate deaminase